MAIKRLVNRMINWWVIDCQKGRCTIGLTVSPSSIVSSYFNRHPSALSTSARRIKDRQSEIVRPMLRCALRWEGLGTGSVKALCWHCGVPMDNPHAVRQCTVAAPDITVVMAKEEQAFARTMERAARMLAAESLASLTGERLAYLHQTHGIDPSIAEGVVGILPESVHEAYRVVYEEHRATGARKAV
jgi:hypothetical protein